MLSSAGAQGLHLIDDSDDPCCVTQQISSEKLFPRTCENCRWGVSFIGKTGGKQCIPNGKAGSSQLRGTSACSWRTARGADTSPARPAHLWLGVNLLPLQDGIDLPWLFCCKGNAVAFIQIVFILANPISFGIEIIQI